MQRRIGWLACVAALALAVAGCDERAEPDASAPGDGGAAMDDAAVDGGSGADGGGTDGAAGLDGAVGFDGGGATDGATGLDGAVGDGGASGTDGGTHADAGTDGGTDAGADAGTDGGTDAGTDAGPGGECISGATGTHAVRFRWRGSGPGSTAYPGYETNELPDTSRWHVGAYSRSIGYDPPYGDTFLGDGGLILEGTAFIDVELSTVGLSSISNVTIAIRGRSYDTTSSGSFDWQTFDGVGAAPHGSVYNSAPYQWYRADATTEFVPGDSDVLLRIYPGPPSNSLVVNRVEICFDAT